MPQLDQEYVFLPQRLLADLPANPAAIGVYALIARLFLIYQEPIPLSAADLQRYDPTLSYGAARGALQRLVALRWLTEQAGHKNCYTPTWGVIKGTARLWQLDAPTLGRPAHVVTLRLDRRLLDVGMGRLIPHPTYPAQTKDRYLEQPIFSLRDVGAYAQTLGGQGMAATPALWRYGLIRDGVAQPLPSAADLIALASQYTLAGDGASPTGHGQRKLGLAPSGVPVPAQPGQPLFFVPRDLIPDPIPASIPELIPSGLEGVHPSCTAERAGSREAAPAPPMPGTPGIPSESSDLPPNPPVYHHSGSGGDPSPSEIPTIRHRTADPKPGVSSTSESRISRQSFDDAVRAPACPVPRQVREPRSRRVKRQGGSAIQQSTIQQSIISHAPPVTESAQLLRSIQTFPSCVEELAAIPAGLVRQAIAYAQAEPGIESVPGWVVAALRRYRDTGWPIPAPRTPGDAPNRSRRIDIEAYLGGAYGDRFRLGSDTTGLRDSAFARPSEAPLERRRSIRLITQGAARYAPRRARRPRRSRMLNPLADLRARRGKECSASALVQPGQSPAAHGVAREAHSPAGTVSAAVSSEDLSRQLQAELILRYGRQYRPVIEGLRIHVAGDTTRLLCATLDDLHLVQRDLAGAIQGILAGLGVPPRLVFTARAGWEARNAAAGYQHRLPKKSPRIDVP